MRGVQKVEFEKLIIDFADGGYHAIRQASHVSLDGDNSQVATITGEDNADCEAKAE